MKKKHAKALMDKKDKDASAKFNEAEIAEEINKNLAEKTKALERIINRSPAIAILWKAEENWPVAYVSENIAQFGYCAEDFLSGKLLFSQIVHPDDLLRVGNEVVHFSQALVNEFTQSYRIITSEGQVRWIDDRTWVLRDENNSITHYEGIIIDITERKTAEDTLSISEEKFAKAFHNSPDIIILTSLTDGRIIEVNEPLEKITGYSRAEFIGKTTHELQMWKNTEDRDRYTKILQRDHRVIDMEVDFRIKSGEIRNVLLSGELIQLQNENYILGVIRDVTEIKKAEKELINSEKRYRMLFDSNPIPMWVYDLETLAFIEVNHSAVMDYGYSRAEFLQMTLKDIRPKEDVAKLIDNIEQKRPDYQHSGEWKHKLKEGRIIDVEIISHRLKYKDRDAVLVMAVNITQRKMAEEAVKKLNIELEERVKTRTAQLEQINQELKTFSYSVSHDLKAPLRGIDGYSKLLLDYYGKELNDEARLFVNNIRTGAHQMGMIIDDLLAYSRLERIEVKRSKVNLNLLIEKIVSLNRKEIDDHQIKINQNIPDAFIDADLDAFTIAFRNVFENAIKFTKNQLKPEITIGFEDHTDNWLIFVKDNGIGFNMIYKDKIFEIFQRLHRIEEYEGTGIGLAMVAKAMQRMGGRVWAESDSDGISAGKGAVFYLEIMK